MYYMDIVVGVLIGLLLFFSCIYAYTKGLQHGKQLSNNQVPKVNLNPVKAVIDFKQAKEAKEESEKLNNELDTILSTTKESMLEQIKLGR